MCVHVDQKIKEEKAARAVESLVDALRPDQFVGETLLDEDIDSNMTRVEAPVDLFVEE